MAVQVGDDADFLMTVAPGGEGLQGQIRAQPGAADTDVDDMGDVLTAANLCSQIQQLLHGRGNLVLAGQAPVGVIGGAVFCVVDDLAGKEMLPSRM